MHACKKWLCFSYLCYVSFLAVCWCLTPVSSLYIHAHHNLCTDELNAFQIPAAIGKARHGSNTVDKARGHTFFRVYRCVYRVTRSGAERVLRQLSITTWCKKSVYSVIAWESGSSSRPDYMLVSHSCKLIACCCFSCRPPATSVCLQTSFLWTKPKVSSVQVIHHHKLHR